MAIVLNPPTGLRDVTQFPDEPGSSAAAREQIQSVIDQVVDKANSSFAAKEQENWIAPTLLNGWTDYSSSYASGYMKDSSGFVHIKGGLKGGATTVNTVLFILPPGYRPGTNREFAVVSNSALGDVIIDASGNVRLQFGSNVSFSLDTITPFKAEN